MVKRLVITEVIVDTVNTIFISAPCLIAGRFSLSILSSVPYFWQLIFNTEATQQIRLAALRQLLFDWWSVALFYQIKYQPLKTKFITYGDRNNIY